MENKICSCCGETKPINEFGKNARAKIGRRSMCKPCVNLKRRNYYYREKDKVLTTSREYFKRNKEHIIKQKCRARRRSVLRLSDGYVRSIMKISGYTKEQRYNSELLEFVRNRIIKKREKQILKLQQQYADLDNK